MASYPAGTQVPVNFALVDPTGAAVTATALSFRIEDADGVELVPATPLALPAAGQPAVVVAPASANTLASGVIAGGRVVKLTITTAAGSLEQEAVYVLRAASGLVLFQTSFQSYAGALVVASGLPDIAAFPSAARPDQELALQLAFRRLSAMAYNFRHHAVPVTDPQSYLFWGAWEDAPWSDWGGLCWRQWWTNLLPEMWPLMTAEIFGHYPQAFRDGLMRAQVYEADAVLSALANGGLTPAAKRDAGILSETVGESSMMFRPGRPLTTPVCPQAMREIRAYLNTATAITRT